MYPDRLTEIVAGHQLVQELSELGRPDVEDVHPGGKRYLQHFQRLPGEPKHPRRHGMNPHSYDTTLQTLN